MNNYRGYSDQRSSLQRLQSHRGQKVGRIEMWGEGLVPNQGGKQDKNRSSCWGPKLNRSRLSGLTCFIWEGSLEEAALMCSLDESRERSLWVGQREWYETHLIPLEQDPRERASQVALVVKNPPANAGDVRNAGSIPGSGRSPGGGHVNPLQYSCLENPMDRGAWRAVVHGIAKSQTWLSNFQFH